jgi:hypothetical protein
MEEQWEKIRELSKRCKCPIITCKCPIITDTQPRNKDDGIFHTKRVVLQWER